MTIVVRVRYTVPLLYLLAFLAYYQSCGGETVMARIEEISVKNYRVLQNITLKDIKPFSVFLGPNGSGKTTFY